MNENNLKKLNSIKLTDPEKNDIRSLLVQKINEPVIKEVQVRHIRRAALIRSPFINNFSIKNMMIPLAIILALSGGLSAAASTALPGDALYPVKVSVNEEVKSALIISPEKQAKWDMKRAEKRIKEAETLAIKGKLNTELKNEISAKFDAHVNGAEKEIEKEKVKDKKKASDMSVEVHKALEARAKAIAELEAKGELTGEARAEIMGIGQIVSLRAKMHKDKIDDRQPTADKEKNQNDEQSKTEDNEDGDDDSDGNRHKGKEGRGDIKIDAEEMIELGI